MISYLSGTLKRMKPDSLQVMVEVSSGIGYEVLLPFFVKRALEERGEGQEVALEIFYYATERHPRPILIGFNREHEKSFFERLLEVEDIGPVKAANALIFSVSTIAKAVEDGDVATLKRMPGIGERTANKIVASLRGKMAQWALLRDEGYDSVPTAVKAVALEQMGENVVAVLMSLGYRRAEARAKVEDALTRGAGVKSEEELIREVFRSSAGSE